MKMCVFQLHLNSKTLSTYMNVLLLALQILLVRTRASETTTNTLRIPATPLHNEPVNSDESLQTIYRDDIKQKEIFESESNQSHSRQKRLVWITDDGRLALPPGTALTFTPTISLPLVRHPPEGFFSNVSISFPLTIDFDKLGLTDESNPLGDLPPIFTREFGRSTGHMLGEYVARYLHYKSKRDLAAQSEAADKESHMFRMRREATQDEDKPELPRLPERFKHAFHGGERVMLYGFIENLLSTFGLNGKACLLRTICEIHARRINHFGVFGEIIKLFLTATSSPYANLIPEYVRAQEIGEGKQAPGECFPYHKECPKSIFRSTERNKYSVPPIDEQENEIFNQDLPPKLPKFYFIKSTETSHEKQQKFRM